MYDKKICFLFLQVLLNKISTLSRGSGKITKIELWRDEWGVGSDWYVNKVVVENTKVSP
jgi:hypothetical protein